jgi:tRNA nucleotidyltransferase/poly(A) polymerase
MLELAREVLADREAWVVGGAVRDELLGRELVDLDIAVRDPQAAARAYAKRSRGAPFPLSERHGAWRVVEDGRTVDFTPLPGSIEDDLATRDFTINAIARPLAGGADVDPFGGLGDLEARRLRVVGDGVFRDDPLRLLRAVRLEDELAGFRIDPATEELVRRDAALVTRPAGERVVAELLRLSPDGYRRLDELGLLAPLGGQLDERLERWDSPEYRLVAVFGDALSRLPVSNELRRFSSALERAERPDADARSIHRFRRTTEPWALEALAFVDALDLRDVVEQSRRDEPAEPLVRGDELGLPPGPEIGRLLAEIDEERAAGTIATREEALDYARRNAGAVRQDG